MLYKDVKKHFFENLCFWDQCCFYFKFLRNDMKFIQAPSRPSPRFKLVVVRVMRGANIVRTPLRWTISSKRLLYMISRFIHRGKKTKYRWTGNSRTFLSDAIVFVFRCYLTTVARNRVAAMIHLRKSSRILRKVTTNVTSLKSL